MAKRPIFNKNPTVLPALVLAAVVAFALWAAFYFDGPPSLKPPKCNAGEQPLLIQEWWCVPVRKP